MNYSSKITELRSPRLRPYAAAAIAEARGYDNQDLEYITGEHGFRHSLIAAAAFKFADEAATDAEAKAASEADRRERDEAELADYMARSQATTSAARAAESAVAAAGWSMRYRYGSAGGSMYWWIEEPTDGERFGLRISDHHAPNGAGWNEDRQERHAEPDVNIVIRRNAAGEYEFDMTPLVDFLSR